jgi:hypothetical protein
MTKPGCLDLPFHFLGFWVADGTFAKGRFKFLISQRDRAILDWFHSHFGGTRSEYHYNNGISYYSVSAQLFAEPMQRANMSRDKKTARTGQIVFTDQDEFFSFFLGFTDGDGSVRAPSFHRSTRISMTSRDEQLLKCLAAGTVRFSGAEGRISRHKQKYHQLVYNRLDARNLAWALSPYLLPHLRKHKLVADIVQNYNYDRAKTFHSKLNEAAYSEMVLLRRQGLSYGEIARRYGVSKQSAMTVIKRRM